MNGGQIVGISWALACVVSAALLGIGWLARRAHLFTLKISALKSATRPPARGLPQEDSDDRD